LGFRHVTPHDSITQYYQVMEQQKLAMPETLENGMDSGPVPERVKRQVFLNGHGICAEPTCDEPIVQDGTTLGDCAHIIPRRVGSHPREDYKTPLEDRNKEENLLYLCKKHHKFVDNVELADFYPADLLREWKQRHEEWAAGVKKDSPPLPQGVQNRLDEAVKQVIEQVDVSAEIIGTLLDTCQEFLDRQLNNEARVLLSQINLLLWATNNSTLVDRAALHNAILMIRDERVSEAKERLLQIIRTNPHYVEAMLEYIELCDNTPEPGDEVEKIEKLTRQLASDHPRLLLIDLSRKFKTQEAVELPDIPADLTDDPRLTARFLCQYALFSDLEQKSEQRDEFINQWENILPNSPRPHLFRVLFRANDLYRTAALSPKDRARLADEALKFAEAEKARADRKDPLTVHDQISWLLEEIRLEFTHVHLSAKDLGEYRRELVSLIAQRYFDIFMNGTLQRFLTIFQIEPEQWKIITHKIQESKMPPSERVVELLFLQALQYDELHAEMGAFVTTYGRSDLSEILQATRDNDATKVAEGLRAKNDPMFALFFLESVANREIAVPLSGLLEVDDEHQKDLLFLRLTILDLHERDNEAADLIPRLPANDVAPHVLHTICRISYQNRQWDLFISAAVRLLDFSIPQPFRNQLHAQLASAYFEQGDDSNAIKYADQALSQSEPQEEYPQIVLTILGQSLVRIGSPDDACNRFQKYSSVKRSFQLLLLEAETYLKSTFPDRHEIALALIIQAFEEATVYDDELYIAPVLSLVELDNAGAISVEDEPTVEDGLFVKLDRFPNGWFYIGEGKSLGAVHILPGTANHDAVIGKRFFEEVAWPADSYSVDKTKRKILHIATAAGYLSHRAHEAMQHLAEIGNAPIYRIHVPEEGDGFNLENLEHFIDQLDSGREFFDQYISTPLPFSFLCTMMGSSLTQALGKIASEKKGFIRCNNGSQADMNAQTNAANDVVQGMGCFIDGLSAFMLVEAELLEAVIEAVPHLGVSTAVIGMLREIAGRIEVTSSQGGRAGVVNGKLRFSPRDKDRDEKVKKHILQSAELLDQLPNKVIGRNYPQLQDDKAPDHLLPSYFVDAFRYAQEKETHLLTDDALFVKAYELFGETPIPRHFSSVSLIRVMVDHGLITWDVYLKYFALLAFYRYHLLPISATDMIQTVITPAEGGLVRYTPQNMSFLNLQLTLSAEYGVDEKTAAGVLASFFSMLILDESIPPDLATEIFALTIIPSLARRNRGLLASVIVQFCRQNIQKRHLVSRRSLAKLKILDEQLFGFATGIDPTAIETMSMLRFDLARQNLN